MHVKTIPRAIPRTRLAEADEDGLLLEPSAKDKFDEIVAFAESVGALDQFQTALDRLASLGGRVILHRDWAAYSLAFVVETRTGPGGSWRFCFNGGLIYDGPGAPCDGSFPQLTVSLTPAKPGEHRWGIHT